VYGVLVDDDDYVNDVDDLNEGQLDEYYYLRIVMGSS
jgi:hypothetical protein